MNDTSFWLLVAVFAIIFVAFIIYALAVWITEFSKELEFLKTEIGRTAAALRAIEIGADIALMAKAVDGVYDKDPRKHADAKKYDAITYSEILDKKLGVIDLTAASLCMEKNMPVLLFSLGKGESIAEALCGNNVGTVINV